MEVVSRATAAHYTWGAACDGWILAPGPDLRVIEERMPAGATETRHLHGKARQFFFVLSGCLTMLCGAQTQRVGPGQGIEIAPGLAHQARNEGCDDLRFLVISAPTTRGDRTELDPA